LHYTPVSILMLDITWYTSVMGEINPEYNHEDTVEFTAIDRFEATHTPLTDQEISLTDQIINPDIVAQEGLNRYLFPNEPEDTWGMGL
jgi:hypothetical protein